VNVIQLIDREITRLETEKDKLLHPLRELFWECTLRCNMNCRHCGSDCKLDTSVPDMPLEHFLTVLDQIAERYTPENILIDLVGGEPLVRQDLDRCGCEVSRRGFEWGIVTNAFLLNGDRLSRLMDNGIASLSIDIDGLQTQHNWLRRNPQSWSKAINAARLLASTGITWDVITCVTPDVCKVLPQLKKELIDNGVKNWRMFTITPMGRAAEDKDLLVSDDDFRRLLDFIVLTREDGDINLSFACEGWLGDYEGKVRDNHYSCQSGLTVASIRANGDISGCLSVRGNYTQGNIYRDSFCDVWENRFECMRDREWMRRDACAECDVFNYCQGNGMHLRKDDGSLMECHYHKLLHSPV